MMASNIRHCVSLGCFTTRATQSCKTIHITFIPRSTNKLPSIKRGQIRPSTTNTNTPKTTATTKTTTTPSTPSDLSTRLRRLAHFIRYTRIPILIISVYGLGYQQGIIDYSRDPNSKRSELLSTILSDVGCHDHHHQQQEKVQIAKEGEWYSQTKSDDIRRISSIAEKIIRVARIYVNSELEQAVQNRLETLPRSITINLNDISNNNNNHDTYNDKIQRALRTDDEVIKWLSAKQRMDGRWSFLFIQTDISNAFVSEILPFMIFVTSSMLQNDIRNDDELSLVLGHEVSHLILGHVTESNALKSVLRTLEILLLSLDPTEGALSLAFMSLVATLRVVMVAANSRESEQEADLLGMKLCAMACYDTRRGAEVFRRMQDGGDGEVGGGGRGGRNLLSFIDTHPPSAERYKYLLETSKEENRKKYETTHCATIRTALREMMFKNASNKSQEVLGNEQEGARIIGRKVVLDAMRGLLP